MKSRHPLSPHGQHRWWLNHLRNVPRLIQAQQSGSGKLKPAYSDSIPAKLKPNQQGGEQK